MQNISKIIFVIIFLATASCKEKGHYDFEKDENPPKYQATELVWKNDSLGAYLYIKNDSPRQRGNRSWLELKVKKNDGQVATYIYYYIDMNYGGIRNDTLLLADLKKETNSKIPHDTCWYFLDSAKNKWCTVEYYFQEKIDSIEKLNILNRMSKTDHNVRGIFKISKEGVSEKLNIDYEKYREDMIDFNKCHECLLYFNISRTLYKYYALNDIITQIKNSDLEIIKPTYTKEGIYESFQ